MAVIPDAKMETLREFLSRHLEPESAVLTDRFPSYRRLSSRGFAHAALRLGGEGKLADRYFPWVPITLSNLKRFLLGTHHKPQAKHLKRYLAEFTYRLNRRWQEASLFDHLTQACLSTNTIIYRDLVAMPEQA